MVSTKIVVYTLCYIYSTNLCIDSVSGFVHKQTPVLEVIGISVIGIEEHDTA